MLPIIPKMAKKLKRKTNVLIEALPYIQKYNHKIVVIKYGGNAMVNQQLRESVMKDIVLLKHVGLDPVIVHGGGPAINRAMKKANLKPKFVRGLRFTDKKTIKIVEKVFKNINQETAALIKKAGGKSISLSGKYYKIICAKQKSKQLGYVGEITKIHPEIIKTLIKDDYIPIISPIGVDGKDQEYNINADTAATALAIALKAEKLTILTDVDGVYKKGKLIRHLGIKDAWKYIEREIISAGMIPKVESCVKAVEAGIPKAHLINGTTEHALLIEIFTDRGVGTEIVQNNG